MEFNTLDRSDFQVLADAVNTAFERVTEVLEESNDETARGLLVLATFARSCVSLPFLNLVEELRATVEQEPRRYRYYCESENE